MKFQLSFMGWKIYALHDRTLGWYQARKGNKYLWADSIQDVKQLIVAEETDLRPPP